MAVDNVYQQKIFTHSLADDVLIVLASYGVTQLSVKCTTSTPGTVLGTGSLGGLAPDAVILTEGDSVSYYAEGKVLSDITITAPSGCTLSITGTGNAI